MGKIHLVYIVNTQKKAHKKNPSQNRSLGLKKD